MYWQSDRDMYWHSDRAGQKLQWPWTSETDRVTGMPVRWCLPIMWETIHVHILCNWVHDGLWLKQCGTQISKNYFNKAKTTGQQICQTKPLGKLKYGKQQFSLKTRWAASQRKHNASGNTGGNTQTTSRYVSRCTTRLHWCHNTQLTTAACWRWVWDWQGPYFLPGAGFGVLLPVASVARLPMGLDVLEPLQLLVHGLKGFVPIAAQSWVAIRKCALLSLIIGRVIVIVFPSHSLLQADVTQAPQPRLKIVRQFLFQARCILQSGARILARGAAVACGLS